MSASVETYIALPLPGNDYEKKTGMVYNPRHAMNAWASALVAKFLLYPIVESGPVKAVAEFLGIRLTEIWDRTWNKY